MQTLNTVFTAGLYEDRTLKSMCFLKYLEKTHSHQLKSSEPSEMSLHLTDWTTKPFGFMTTDEKKGLINEVNQERAVRLCVSVNV